MPTIEEVGTDLELIQHLDFDTETPCHNPDCNEAAAWSWRCKFCGYGGNLCPAHHQENLQDALLACSIAGMRCKGCSAAAFFDIAEVFAITPLGGDQ